MNDITVSYRFTPTELSALLQASGLGALPGAPLYPVEGEAAQAALKQIVEKEMALVVDGTVCLDRLIDCLLRSAAGCDNALVITDSRRTVVLWQAEKLFVLGDFPEAGECSLTPLQDLAMATDALSDALVHMPRPLWAMNAFHVDRHLSVPADDGHSPLEIARAAVVLLDRSVPEG